MTSPQSLCKVGWYRAVGHSGFSAWRWQNRLGLPSGEGGGRSFEREGMKKLLGDMLMDMFQVLDSFYSLRSWCIPILETS